MFRVNGAWTASPVKGDIVGVVDAGLPSATAYFNLRENLNDIDFNSDGDKSDQQIRFAVNSSALQVVPGVVTDNNWLQGIIVHASAITQFEGSVARHYKGNGVISTTPIAATAGAFRRTLDGVDVAFGRYIVKGDGTIVDSGLIGTVVGRVGQTPVVDLIVPSSRAACCSPGTARRRPLCESLRSMTTARCTSRSFRAR
jgi:hypothetical protein